MSVRLLVDECVNRRVVLPPFLPLIECVFVADLAPTAPDADVLELARQAGMLLLTEDADFGRLVFAERRAPPLGIILVTMPKRPAAERAERVHAEAEVAIRDAVGALVVIDADRRRRRAFPVL